MFATDSAYGDLLVVVTPQQGPVIHGAKSRLENVFFQSSWNVSFSLELANIFVGKFPVFVSVLYISDISWVRNYPSIALHQPPFVLRI